MECGCDCPSPTVHEEYCLRFDPRPAKKIECRCQVPGLIDDDVFVHDELARWVTRHRPREHRSSCITLANVQLSLDPSARCGQEHIDITVRPIVYSNDLLFEMILGLLHAINEDNA
jgi:hypothetical protein